MHISDRRFEELLTSMRRRQGAIESGASAGRIGAKTIHYLQVDPMPAPTDVAPEVKTVLLVDPDTNVLRTIQDRLRLVANVEACSGFWEARGRLLAKPPDLLVTNLRLHAYNGLHLVHLAAGEPTRCVVYATYTDLALAREAQAAGAFYERSHRLTFALPSYLSAVLPAHDRRTLTAPDPLKPFWNRRRSTDQ